MGWLCGSGLLWSAAWNVARAQSAAPRVLVVSEPPAPVLPSDPPTGLIFSLPRDLSAAAPTFDASGITAEPVRLEYLRFDDDGNGYVTFHDGSDAPATGGVLIIDAFATPSGVARVGGTFDAARDRLISGAEADLAGPRDLAVADELGVVVVADFAEADLKVFDLAFSGTAAPLFVTTNLGQTAAGEPRAPWGIAFDSVQDRLFVGATDGTVLVYDDYLLTRGESGPDRVIVPTVDGVKASTNLHGVGYLADRDLLILADVGSAATPDEAGFDADGKLFVVRNASSAAGDTAVAAQLSGPESLLGNPVGVAFDGDDVYVAEKAGNVVLRFDDVLTMTGVTERAPNGAVTVVAPESVVLVRE